MEPIIGLVFSKHEFVWSPVQETLRKIMQLLTAAPCLEFYDKKVTYRLL